MKRQRSLILLAGVFFLLGLFVAFLAAHGRNPNDDRNTVDILPAKKEEATGKATIGTLLLDDEVSNILTSIGGIIDEHVPVAKSDKSASPQRAVSDERWKQFPKESFDYCTVMRFGPAGISVDRLFRHSLLNPLDKVMSISEENELRHFVEEGMREVDRIAQLRGAAISDAMTDLIAKGLTKTRPGAPPDDEGVVSMEASGDRGSGRSIHRIVDGIVHTAAESDMPMAAQLAEMEEFANINMAAAIASWFHNRGFCPESNYSSIITRLSKAQDRFPPRRPKRKDRGK